MRKLPVILAAVVLSAFVSGAAGAAAQMSEEEYRAALATCKKEANAQKRDECVSNAKNRFEKGMGAEKKATDMKEGGMAKGKSETDAASKGAMEKMKKK